MRVVPVLACILFLSACATWATSDVTAVGSTSEVAISDATEYRPEDIVVTEADISDRKYRALGDIDVTVNKTTIFNAAPTPEKVNDELRKVAAKLGADAVILVRYGTVGISGSSWGSLSGKGRAIVFVD